MIQLHGTLTCTLSLTQSVDNPPDRRIYTGNPEKKKSLPDRW